MKSVSTFTRIRTRIIDTVSMFIALVVVIVDTLIDVNTRHTVSSELVPSRQTIWTQPL